MSLINNLSIYRYGNENNQPVIFVHGFPYDNSMWNKQIEFFKEKFYCITYDVRGLGNSEVGNGQFTMELFVDDLFNIIDELNLEKPVICGLSMGGYITLRALEREQSKFKAAILCDTKSEADNKDAKLKRAGGIKSIDNEGLDNFIENTVPKTFAENTVKSNTDDFKRIMQQAKSENPIGVKGSLLAMLSRTDTTDFLSEINIPVLLICGIEDALTPPETMKKMAEKIKGSVYAEIPNAGHMAPLENPEAVNRYINDFLYKL